MYSQSPLGKVYVSFVPMHAYMCACAPASVCVRSLREVQEDGGVITLKTENLKLHIICFQEPVHHGAQSPRSPPDSIFSISVQNSSSLHLSTEFGSSFAYPKTH